MKYKILKEVFNYENFRDNQEQVIDSILSRKNTISIMATGAGKSITFQIPALIFSGVSIVISPLISLMYDQVYELKKRNISAEYINSSLDYFTLKKIYNNLINNKIKILYISPERLLNKIFIENIKKVKISMLVIDEAHTIMWYMDFRESFLNIKKFLKMFDYDILTTCFSATISSYTINEIKDILGIYNFNIIVSSFDRHELYYKIEYNKDKIKYIKEYVSNNKNKIGIIYAQTKNDLYDIYNNIKDITSVGVYHGRLNSNEKEYIQNKFLKEKINVMVCTISFGMGINKSNIRYIINYNIPDSVESLVQMIGRCSRDKQYGECIVLYNKNDDKMIKFFISNINSDNKKLSYIKRVKEYKEDNLIKLLNLLNSNKCIHKNISLYFKKNINDCINMCSNCKRKYKIK